MVAAGRGRKRVPSVLHELHGNPRGRPPPKHEPKPVGDLADPPDWMSPEQQDAWRYAIAHSPPGLLKRLDRGVLAVWVSAETLHRNAVIQQSLTGLVIKAPITGTPMPSPYLSIINRQAAIMLKAADQMGFSPVSRPRIGAGIAAAIKPPPTAKVDETAPTLSLEDYLDSAPSTAIN